MVLEGEAVVAWNGIAEALFGVSAADPGSAAVLRRQLDGLLALAIGAPTREVVLSDVVTVSAVHRAVGDRHVLLLRDISATVRREEGLRRIAALSRRLLGAEPTVPVVLQTFAGEAKALTGAAYSALLLLREGSTTDSSHFVYDAPRELFPDRMPRAVGLLAVPLSTRQPARLDDIRGHALGVGLPGVHPPIGPLAAVPLVAGDVVLGELAVANPPGGRAFDELDESLLVDLAAHAAAAVAWAQGAERERERALVRQEDVDMARHDMRTPLGAGKGFAQLLQRRRDRMSPDQVETSLQGLVDAFARLESFGDRLLADERTAPAAWEPAWAAVAIDPLMRAVVRDAESLSGRPGSIRWLGDEAPASLAGDPEMVRQVLDNLVGNALKHAGTATVTARREGGHVRFDVRDSGPGIAEAEQGRLFDRWTRTVSTRRSGLPGEGLGLSIVKRLVAAHGGTVGVSSRPGEGATFWVTFPRELPVPA